MSIQEECSFWSKSSGTGINCADSATANVSSKSNDDFMVLSELIASAVEGKDFDEDNQVQNQLKLVKTTKTQIACNLTLDLFGVGIRIVIMKLHP